MCVQVRVHVRVCGGKGGKKNKTILSRVTASDKYTLKHCGATVVYIYIS